MVAKIITGKSIKGILNYNEHKVKEGLAEFIFSSMFLRELHELTFHDKLLRFERLLEKSPAVKTNALHISLNFDIGERLELERLQAITIHYMDKIGFGDQPYLVYRHLDAAHPHLHIVTTNIRPDGTRIDLHNIGRNRSEPARKEIELEFGLVQAESKKPAKTLYLEPIKLQKMHYGKSETKRNLAHIVTVVSRDYNYTSLSELNAVLREYGVTADRGHQNSQMHHKKGLIYHIISEQGEKVGVPIKASALPGKPTMTYLEKRFIQNRESRTQYRADLLRSLDKAFFTPCNSREDYARRLQKKGIQVLFRENAEGLTYGVTYIDHYQKAVINGSELGKGYGAKALLERLSPDRKTVPSTEGSFKQSNGPHIPGGTVHAGDTFTAHGTRIPDLLENLWRAEQQDAYTPYPLRKQKRKRKKRSPNL